MPHITFAETEPECSHYYRSFIIQHGNKNMGIIHCDLSVINWLDERINIQSRAGSVSSIKKSSAARRNGKKGGRPKVEVAK